MYLYTVVCARSPEEPDVELENWVEPGRPQDEDEKVSACLWQRDLAVVLQTCFLLLLFIMLLFIVAQSGMCIPASDFKYKTGEMRNELHMFPINMQNMARQTYRQQLQTAPMS